MAPFTAMKAIFDFNIKQVIQSGNIALMHTDWKVSSPEQMSVYAIEVARRQPDGTWRWLIGDPFYSRQAHRALKPRGTTATMTRCLQSSVSLKTSLWNDGSLWRSQCRC
jgi:hypothetical protein